MFSLHLCNPAKMFSSHFCNPAKLFSLHLNCNPATMFSLHVCDQSINENPCSTLPTSHPATDTTPPPPPPPPPIQPLHPFSFILQNVSTLASALGRSGFSCIFQETTQNKTKQKTQNGPETKTQEAGASLSRVTENLQEPSEPAREHNPRH